MEAGDDIIHRAHKGDDIELTEYMQIVSGYMDQQEWCKLEMREAFEVFDTENTNNVTFGDVRRVFHELGEKLTDVEIEEQMKEFAEKTEDKVLNLTVHDFSSMILNLHPVLNR